MTERTASVALVRLVADLLEQLEGTAVSECEFRSGEFRVLLRRSNDARPVQVVSTAVAVQDEIPSTWRPITAPLTGIFYLTETPQSAPFVVEGSIVIAGQPVGLIESMKMYNPVESDLSGVVRSILVTNGSLVEKDQTLMHIDPQGAPE